MKTVVTNLRQNRKIELRDIILDTRCIIAIDASTKNTGICIIEIGTERPLYSISLSRESNETAIEYKVAFKGIIADLILNNGSVYKNVRMIIQEEPFISAMKTTTEVLMSLRTSVPELLVEHKDLLEEFEYHEMNNKTWKKKLFSPDKCPGNTEAEKRMAKEKIGAIHPIYLSLTQDEIDACGIGIISCRLINSGVGIKDKQRISRFSYNIDFVGGDSLEAALENILELDIPKQVLETGYEMASLPANGNLEKRIFEAMGEDDKLLIFEFSPSKAGNLVLKYKLSYLAEIFDTLYAVVWRKNRKKKS